MKRIEKRQDYENNLKKFQHELKEVQERLDKGIDKGYLQPNDDCVLCHMSGNTLLRYLLMTLYQNDHDIVE